MSNLKGLTKTYGEISVGACGSAIGIDCLELIHAGSCYKNNKWHQFLAVVQDLQGIGCAVQDAHSSAIDHILDGLQMCAIEVTIVFTILQEFVLFDGLLHFLPVHEPIAHTILLQGAFGAAGI